MTHEPPGAQAVTGAEAVEERIRRLSVEGASPHTIAAALNAEGLRTASGRRWHSKSVTQALWRGQPGDPSRVLPDRAGLLAHMTRALQAPQPGSCLAILVLDIVGLRHVNSAFGHLAGDAVLVEMAERLDHLFPHEGTVARLGGGAFALLTRVPATGDASSLEHVVGAVQSEVTAPYVRQEGPPVAVAVVIGVATERVGLASAASLLHGAELAMYRAKGSVSSWAAYRAELDEPACGGLAEAAALRSGISSGGLTLHYQPVVDLTTGQVHSVEALVRWKHPERGLLQPADFLPLAERFGLMGELTEAVVAQVAEQVHLWRQAGRSLVCGVNLTGPCLTDPRSGERLVTALCGLRGSVTVEVVESVMADAAALRVLERLVDAGVGCAIDDFGAGRTNLAGLTTLPARTLKLDRSLIGDTVQDPREVDVVHAVVRLAQALGRDVVAEGIETQVAANLVRTAGVHLAQGYLWGRPMPAAVLETWLEAPPSSVPVGAGPDASRARTLPSYAATR